MSDPVENVLSIVIEITPTNLKVVPLEESSVSTRRQSVDYSIERKRALRARYVYALIFFFVNLMAWFIRDFGHSVFPKLPFLESCGKGGRDCLQKMGVLRVSLGCFIFSLLMFLTTCQSSKLYEARNTWHSRWWALKFPLVIIAVAIPFYCPAPLIHLYGEFARIGAGVFLLLQLISVIHFITWWNNCLMSDATSQVRCFLGLFASTIFYSVSVCGIVLMYFMYGPMPSCILNIFFISWTFVLLVVMMVVSLHSKVNRGLLSSGIMGSYIVYLCWSAIRSEPVSSNCSPKREASENDDWATVLGFFVAIFAIVMAAFSTGIDSQSFQFRKSEVEGKDDDIPYNYGYFHMVFSMGAMYFAMLFISWELDHPTTKSTKWSIDVGWASTWVKIANEWFAVTIFLWKLISPSGRERWK